MYLLLVTSLLINCILAAGSINLSKDNDKLTIKAKALRMENERLKDNMEVLSKYISEGLNYE